MTSLNLHEQQKWRKNFEINANVIKDGVKFLDKAAFIDAIAPSSGRGHARISREQYSVFFDVADKSKKGLISVSYFTLLLVLSYIRGAPSSTRHECQLN